MKKIIIIALSLALLSGLLFYFLHYRDCCVDGKCVASTDPVCKKNVVSLKGVFKGQNLFFQNPFLGKDKGFCINQIKINDDKIMEISTTAFEIDLLGMGFKEGDKVSIEIIHKEGCLPKILNPEVINPDVSAAAVNNSLKSEITCPECGHKKQETMPADVCQLAYTCESCKAELRPKSGDCCVYCSYGSKKCPSMQSGG